MSFRDVLRSSNFVQFFAPSPLERELRETQRAWKEVDRKWRASSLATGDFHDHVMGVIRKAMDAADRAPATPILVALAEATETIFEAEDLGALEAVWPVIATDAAAAVEFRQMLARRGRWVGDFDRMKGIVERQLLGTYTAFFKLLPESCFEDWKTADGEPFEVPLIDLVDNPALAVELFLVAPYGDDTLRFDLFQKFRHVLERNLLVASGFSPADNAVERQEKLIMPALQKHKTPAELADLYLRGTPYRAVMELGVPFRIPDTVRFEHCHIIGGTGHGKTQLMQRMIHGDLIAATKTRRSVVVIDSQGDLINKLMRLDLFSPDVEGSLADRLIIIDPSDVEFPASLNLFDAHLDRLKDYSPRDRERVQNGVIELYEIFFGALLGAELTQKQGVIFKYLARLMLTIEGATIHTLMRLMEDGKPFKPHMEKLEGSARFFFEKEFFDPSFSATKKQILKRLWGVLSTPAFERMFAQAENKLDLFEALNEGKIILINTAKDLLKEEGSQLFGRFFIAMLAQAALERSTLPERERTPTFVYVDEAQEYFDDRIETILSQARKYRLGLTLAHQTLDQLSPRLRAAFLSNTSTKCVGGVSAKDAHTLSAELHTTPDFVESMKRRRDRTEFAVWVKHQTPQAIRMTVPLGFLERQPTLAEEDFDALIETNRELYCGRLEEVLSLSPSVESPEEMPRSDLPSQTVERSAKSESQEAPAIPPHTAAESISSTPQAFSAGDNADGGLRPLAERRAVPPKAPVYGAGKGGAKHRYLQSLVKEMGEQQGFRATLEAPLKDGSGQIDVLLERDALAIAVEISVTTPTEHERKKVGRCLAVGYDQVVIVLAKSKAVQSRSHVALLEGLQDNERQRLSILAPEEVPDFIAALAPPPETSESLVKGYLVKVSRSPTTPAEAKTRRETLAKIIRRSAYMRKD
ncbi:DUF87 domain-containing protein [Parvibaculum sp.]|uniref:type IV secretory system conjugative DNA transfer family protein n=1 Tax=Parvibaculum sp. TaxID=2024848 RepID=UPI00262E04D5|nr:DUF87 domain-containing protein [Parvibaculum sp.]MCW5726215.1 type IV secretion system DNA-binding domain-containing protein [Parvibaculum sp.]